MSRRSDWAKLANTLKIGSPETMVVPIAPPQIDLSPIPRWRKSPTMKTTIAHFVETIVSRK
jgi:hypothetical protein